MLKQTRGCNMGRPPVLPPEYEEKLAQKAVLKAAKDVGMSCFALLRQAAKMASENGIKTPGRDPKVFSMILVETSVMYVFIVDDI